MTDNTNETVNPATGELVERNSDSAIPSEYLAQIQVQGDVESLLGRLGISEVEDFEDYGSGFELLEDKDELLGVPFLIVEWRWNWSDTYEQHFASITLITSNDDKFIVNDGSVKAGIAAQLRTIEAKRAGNPNLDPANRQRAVKVRGGLSRSDYKARGKQGDANYRPAGTTYFLVATPPKSSRR